MASLSLLLGQSSAWAQLLKASGHPSASRNRGWVPAIQTEAKYKNHVSPYAGTSLSGSHVMIHGNDGTIFGLLAGSTGGVRRGNR
ncbi:hypothetical protein BDV11DRAFT_179313 [Aspergillus similis]